MYRREFLKVAAVSGIFAEVAPAALAGLQAAHPGLPDMQRALWRALDACEAFTRSHTHCDCDEQSAREGEEKHAAWSRYNVCWDMHTLPYLIRLFASVLDGFSATRRPLPGPLPRPCDCAPNDIRHVAAALALGEAQNAGRAVLRACPVTDCPVCEHVEGIVEHLTGPVSLLHGELIGCKATEGRAPWDDN